MATRAAALAMDALVFDPSSIELDTGKTVTFVVINSGKLPHEFVAGGVRGTIHVT